MERLSSAPTSTETSPGNLFCISCGYNARGITSTHCPECGQDYTLRPPLPTRLPWLHRRHIGLLRAYCRTVLIVTFHPKFFCEQVDNPITLKDARRFWLVTIVLAYLPIIGAAVQIYHMPSQPDTILRWVQSLFLYGNFFSIGVYAMLGLLFFLITATGMPSYFCHSASIPMQRQNRSIALSYFAAAPLALMPFIVAALIFAQLLQGFSSISLTLQILAAILAFFMFGAWYFRTAGIVLTLSQGRRRILTVLLITLSWLFLLGFFLIVVPIGFWYAQAMLRVLF